MSLLTEQMVAAYFGDVDIPVRLELRDGDRVVRTLTPRWSVSGPAASTAISVEIDAAEAGIEFDRVVFKRDGVDVKTERIGRTVVPTGSDWSATVAFSIPEMEG